MSSDWSGNLLCVWIIQRKEVELKPSFANLLKCLSIYDSVLLVRSSKFLIKKFLPIVI